MKQTHPWPPSLRRTIAAVLLAIGQMAMLSAQSLQLGVLYTCPGAARGFKVLSCSGPGDAAACDLQAFTGTQPGPRISSPRAQVMALVQVCRPLKPGEAPPAAPAPPGGSPQADV